MKTLNPFSSTGFGRFLLHSCLVLCLAGGVAHAHRSPSNCGGGALQMQLFKFLPNGPVANVVTPGQPVVFAVMLQNDANLITPAGVVPACDVTGLTVILKTPDPQGNATVTSVLATDLNIPFGTPPFFVGMVTSVVDTVSGVSLARASASVHGVLHDVTIPGCTPNGSSTTNACDPTAAFVERFTSIPIMRPALSISAQCLSATNDGNTVFFTLAGSVTNSGNETLVNIEISNDSLAFVKPLTNISSLAPGAVVSFVVSDTLTDHFCPVLTNRLKATCTSLATGSPITAEGECSSVIAAQFSLRPPHRLSDGSTELVVDCPRGWNYSIEASTNLLDWVTLSSHRGTLSETSYIDFDAVNFPSRFYRTKASCSE